MTERQKAYMHWLCSVDGIGSATARRLLGGEALDREPEEIYETCRTSRGMLPEEYGRVLRKEQADSILRSLKTWDVEREYEKLMRQKISFVTVCCEDYPDRLRHIPDPPCGIYYKGRLPAGQRLSVALIGARECSEYGKFVGIGLGKALGERGIQVISGMARGIDGISQEAALDAGGDSYGVLGCGVDVCYPKSAQTLYKRLEDSGGILSAYSPGTQPKASLFPPRNRIVSGLSDAVVVVEARQKSGTLITVDMALEQGREVYVVPGRITDRLSDGCNRLIRQGAGIVLSPEDFLQEMADRFPKQMRLTAAEHEEAYGRRNAGCKKKAPAAGNTECGQKSWQQDPLMRKVYESVDFYPKSVEQIREAAGLALSYGQMQQILTKLCLAMKVRQAGAGFYEKNISCTGF